MNQDNANWFSAFFSGQGGRQLWPSCGIYSYGHVCKPGVAYILRCGDLYKIGYSGLGCGLKTLNGRINSISASLQIPFAFEHAVWANCGRGLEAFLHGRYSKFRFEVRYQLNIGLNKSQEIFRLSADDYAWILALKTHNDTAVTHFNSIADLSQFLAARQEVSP